VVREPLVFSHHGGPWVTLPTWPHAVKCATGCSVFLSTRSRFPVDLEVLSVQVPFSQLQSPFIPFPTGFSKTCPSSLMLVTLGSLLTGTCSCFGCSTFVLLYPVESPFLLRNLAPFGAYVSHRVGPYFNSAPLFFTGLPPGPYSDFTFLIFCTGQSKFIPAKGVRLVTPF